MTLSERDEVGDMAGRLYELHREVSLICRFCRQQVFENIEEIKDIYKHESSGNLRNQLMDRPDDDPIIVDIQQRVGSVLTKTIIRLAEAETKYDEIIRLSELHLQTNNDAYWELALAMDVSYTDSNPKE